MSEPLPGSVTVAPDGQTYIYFGGVWGKAEGVTGGIKVDYNTLDIKPETSFNDAVNKMRNLLGLCYAETATWPADG